MKIQTILMILIVVLLASAGGYFVYNDMADRAAVAVAAQNEENTRGNMHRLGMIQIHQKTIDMGILSPERLKVYKEELKVMIAEDKKLLAEQGIILSD